MDVKGVVFGVICVIMFYGVFVVKGFDYEVDCNLEYIDEVINFDFEGKVSFVFILFLFYIKFYFFFFSVYFICFV